MRILASLILILATALPSLAATVYPASTNANQTFFGTNTFTKSAFFLKDVTSTNFIATSPLVDPSKGVLGADGQSGLVRLTDNGGNAAIMRYTIGNGWEFTTSPLYGNGDGLTNLNPANLVAGTAGISITGTAAVATAALSLNSSGTINANGGINAASLVVTGAVSLVGTITTATNIVAPTIINWAGPTNSLTLGYPWIKTTYTMTSDISLTNFLGVMNGQPCSAVLVLTNSAATNCAVRVPASVTGFGTLITNQTAYVLAGKKAILSVLSGTATNWGVVQQSQ